MKNVKNYFNNKVGFILIVMTLVFILFNACYFRWQSQSIQDTLLNEKYIEIVNFVDMLTVTVDADVERGSVGYEETIIDSAEYIDRLYQIYAAAYRIDDDGTYRLITKREVETSAFTPFDYDGISDIVDSNETGSFIITYTPELQTERDMRVYFKKMPTDPESLARYVVFAGVTKYSVESKIDLWVSLGQWVSIGILFVLVLGHVYSIAQAGYLYSLRGGDKWRNKGR